MKTVKTLTDVTPGRPGPAAATIYAADLIRSVAQAHGRSQRHYRQVLNDIVQAITEQLSHGRQVQLIGFGTFYTREQPPGRVKSLQTGTMQNVPARRVAAFRVGALLKQAVRQKPKKSAGRPRKGIAASVTSALGSFLKTQR
jgi:DNA-binding protein HU-beta